MKKINKLKTGIISRNLAFAKLATKIGKDIYFSKKEEIDKKLTEVILKRSSVLKDELGELKGSFLKAGQMLSMYTQDLLPKEFQEVLSELSGQTSYLNWDLISKQIPFNVIEDFDIEKDAFAAASIGQVHKAYRENKEYAIKVQYKNIEKLIDTDLWILKKLINLLKVVPKSYNFEEVFKEIKAMLLNEMDYEKERHFTRKFKDLVEEDYIVPQVYDEYCSKKVLCFEYINGETVDTYLKKATPQHKESLAKSFFQLFLKEIFSWKILQSDAHPGNYLIKDHKWVLLDFGATKEIQDLLYERLIHALFTQDRALLERTLRDHGAMNMEETDLDYFWSYCLIISEPLQNRVYSWKTSNIVNDVMLKSKDLVKKVKFHRLPSENIFIDRKIAGIYFMLKKLEADLNLYKVYNEFKSSL